LIGRKRVTLVVGRCGRFLFFVVPRQFLQDICEWLENQILIPDWTYFHCPGATLKQDKIKPPLLSTGLITKKMGQGPQTVTAGGSIKGFLEDYDSLSGETGGSKVYMIYELSRAYPEYLITYTD